MFCKAKLLEGKLYQQLLPTNLKAKNCFRQIMDIGICQNYVNTIWFKEATKIFQKMKEDEIVEEPKKNRDAYIKELNKKLNF